MGRQDGRPYDCNSCSESCKKDNVVIVINAFKKGNDIVILMVKDGEKFLLPTKLLCNSGDYVCHRKVKNPHPGRINSDEVPVLFQLSLPEGEFFGSFVSLSKVKGAIPKSVLEKIYDAFDIKEAIEEVLSNFN